MNALHPPANFELDAIWNDFERDPEVWVGILTGRRRQGLLGGQRPALHRRARPRHDPHGGERLRRPRQPHARAGSRSSPRSTATRSAAASRWRSPATSSSPPTTPGSACPSRRVGLMAGAGRRAPAAAHDPPEDRDGLHPHGAPHDRPGGAPPGRGQRGRAARRAHDRPRCGWAEEILECAPLSIRASKQAVADGARAIPSTSRSSSATRRPSACGAPRTPSRARAPSPRSASRTGRPARAMIRAHLLRWRRLAAGPFSSL